MDTRKQEDAAAAGDEAAVSPLHRATLRRLGRFAAMTPPAVNLLLSALSKPAAAVGTSGAPVSSRQFKEPVSVSQLRKRA
jgi:hypothetical protein